MGHSHADDATPVAIVSPVSCIEPGYSTYVCDVCGVNYDTDYVQGDHVDSGGYSYRIEATCTNDGYDEFECGECGEYYIVVKSASRKRDILPELTGRLLLRTIKIDRPAKIESFEFSY